MTRLKTKLIYLLGGVPYDFHKMEVAAAGMRSDERAIRAENNLARVTKLIDKTPADCNRGAWCKACAFGKRSVATIGVGSNMRLHEFVYCVKDECCKHFKEGANDEIGA